MDRVVLRWIDKRYSIKYDGVSLSTCKHVGKLCVYDIDLFNTMCERGHQARLTLSIWTGIDHVQVLGARYQYGDPGLFDKIDSVIRFYVRDWLRSYFPSEWRCVYAKWKKERELNDKPGEIWDKTPSQSKT